MDLFSAIFIFSHLVSLISGVIALEVLRRLERQTGHLIHELFDIMVGVSTGSIITSLLGIKKLTVDEVDDIYTRLVKCFDKISRNDGEESYDFSRSGFLSLKGTFLSLWHESSALKL